jgi:hypothetical protein
MTTRRPHVVFALVLLAACASGDNLGNNPTDSGSDPDTSGPPPITSMVVSPEGVTIPVEGTERAVARLG